MRKIKAIYLLPVFVLLLGGAACGGYFGMISPQMQKTEAARGVWMQKINDWKQSEPKYKPALEERVKYAQSLYDGYSQFHMIQNTMPEVYDMAEMYPDPITDKKSPKSKRIGLQRWYTIMATGQMVNEVNRWIRRFYLDKPPTVKIDPTKPMGYEETLPDKKVVTVDLGDQVYQGRGINDLCTKISKSIGYGYFPLIISLPGGNIDLHVDRNDPRHSQKLPFLSMKYGATGYFMTRAWDPKGADADKERDDAKVILLNPPIKAYKDFVEPVKDCPPLLGFIPVDYSSAAKGGGAPPPPSSGGAPATGAPKPAAPH